MDFEEFGRLTKKEINDISKEFLTRVEEKTRKERLQKELEHLEEEEKNSLKLIGIADQFIKEKSEKRKNERPPTRNRANSLSKKQT